MNATDQRVTLIRNIRDILLRLSQMRMTRRRSGFRADAPTAVALIIIDYTAGISAA